MPYTHDVVVVVVGGGGVVVVLTHLHTCLPFADTCHDTHTHTCHDKHTHKHTQMPYTHAHTHAIHTQAHLSHLQQKIGAIVAANVG